MPVISKEFIIALRRKRGEENITVEELSRQTNVSSWTLRHLLNEQRLNVRPSTLDKINQWLYKHS